MKESPLLSVIVPVYNMEKYLERCIDSILSQSFRDFELILINDGSKDKSLEICERYKDKDDRVILLDKNNEGVSVARNCGLNTSSGKYITFIDSDDCLLDKYTFELVLPSLLKDEAITMVQFPVVSFETMGVETLVDIESTLIEDKRNYLNSIFINKKITGFVCGKIFRSDFFIDAGFKRDIKFAEDTLLLLENIHRIRKVAIVLYGKYGYFIRNNSASKTWDNVSAFQFHLLHFKAFQTAKDLNIEDNLLIKYYIKAFFTYADAITLNGKKNDFKAKIKELTCCRIKYKGFDNLSPHEMKWIKIISKIGVLNAIKLYVFSQKIHIKLNKLKI